jgi:hypothetical protein
MANVLNRTTKVFHSSVNTPDYPVEDWIINPNLDAVVGFAPRYWIITGDVITLMDQAARDAVDAARLVAKRDAIADQIEQVESYTRAFALVVLDEINILRTAAGLGTRTAAQLKTAVRNKLDT